MPAVPVPRIGARGDGCPEDRSPEALALLHRVRTHTDLPLAIGFGISTPDHVKTCQDAGADGVIVGSAIVDIVEKNLGNPVAMENAIRQYVAGMKNAAKD